MILFIEFVSIASLTFTIGASVYDQYRDWNQRLILFEKPNSIAAIQKPEGRTVVNLDPWLSRPATDAANKRKRSQCDLT